MLAAEREAQELRLELTERDKTMAAMREALARSQDQERSRAAAELQARFERLLSALAAPAAQVLMQGALLEAGSRPIESKDVLSVAKRLVRALEDEGLRFEGDVGATVDFDPNHHEPLSGSQALTPGQAVLVRVPGVSFHGKILRRAGVEAREFDAR